MFFLKNIHNFFSNSPNKIKLELCLKMELALSAYKFDLPEWNGEHSSSKLNQKRVK